jgi:branched-chain amino acid transport system substrate-binding protein
MIGRSSRLAFIAAAIGLVLVLAACGSSSSSSSGGSTASGSTSSGSSASLSSATSVYGSFVGGTAGKASSSKPPVTIGFVNDEGGIPSFPEGSVAAQAAVTFLNDNLGGINGSRVELSVCKVAGSEEQGQACAQQFLANHAVNVISEDSLVVGAQTFHRTLAGKEPVVVGSPNAVADGTATNTWPISAGVFGTDPGFVYYATQVLKVKTAALLFPADDPTGQVAAKQIKGDLSKAGVKVTTGGYTSSSADILPVVQASGAPSADVTIALLPSPPTCIAGAKALQQANITKPVLALAQCIAQPVKAAVGDYPKWTYISVSTNPVPGGDQATQGYLDVMKAYAPSGANDGGFAPHAFMSVLTAAKMLAQAGGASASGAKVEAALKAFTGPVPMFPPQLKWGIVPPLPALGTVQSRLYTYQGNGNWKDATGGKWVPTS